MEVFNQQCEIINYYYKPFGEVKKIKNYINGKNDLGLLYYQIQDISNYIHCFVIAAKGQYPEAFYNFV